jgi:hypothetical protein
MSDSLSMMAIFHTLYITKMYGDHVILTSSIEDIKILESIGVSKENIMLIKDINNAQDVALFMQKPDAVKDAARAQQEITDALTGLVPPAAVVV